MISTKVQAVVLLKKATHTCTSYMGLLAAVGRPTHLDQIFITCYADKASRLREVHLYWDLLG